MKIINLTPHAITVVTEAGEPIATIAPSGTVARCQEVSVKVGEVGGIPIFSTTWGEVEGLPEPQEGVAYVASALVAQAAARAGRTDVFSPAKQVRNDEGQVVGCLGLQRPTA